MMKLEVPRLLLQPIVENAVIHGIERSMSDGMVLVSGEPSDRYYTIRVEDNGIGMSDETLAKLRRDVELPPNDDTGCALWNIHQRLILQFGNASVLEFDHRPDGGVI